MRKNSQDRYPLKNGGNRLGSEKSPYLLQHAGNPVDWWPWCPEAFEQARHEDKPVFLSIGYATCHWCHVMEKESFENEEVAAFLNAHFISVKVDREERPDIDALYMNACILMTGGGGWPLNVVLTPDKKPFYAATYIPRNPSRGHPGIIPLLMRIVVFWKQDRAKIEENGDLICRHLKESEWQGDISSPISDEPLFLALQHYAHDFDSENGGFGGAPKFPMPHNLMLLLRLHERYGDENALAMVSKTLKSIRSGGIYDQLGFGIHRYAVDGAWQVPHFEKMLYDQALFVLACLETCQATGDRVFGEMAADTLDYVKTCLCHPDGAFYCGEDADSEGAEGTFYLWDKAEILSLLDQEDGERFCRLTGVSDGGNFEGRNILHLAENVSRSEEDDRFLECCRKKLLAARSRRIRPFLDDKILTSWNGLMIAAFAKAGAVLGENRFIVTARRAADFILQNLYDKENARLLRRWREGTAAVPGFLEDYSFFCWGLLELYMACLDSAHLDKTRELVLEMTTLFGDGKGGFFDTGSDKETILTRGRNLRDGALPSGTSVAILNLLRLGELCGDQAMAAQGVDAVSRFFSEMARVPLAYPFLLIALDWAFGPVSTLTLAAESLVSAASLLRSYHGAFLPRSTVVLEKPRRLGKASLVTAQVCRQGTCYPVTNDGEAMVARLMGRVPPALADKK